VNRRHIKITYLLTAPEPAQGYSTARLLLTKLTTSIKIQTKQTGPQLINKTQTRHRASTSMYSLTLCVCVMSPERHHWKPWKPAVQAAAVMLRTPPVDGQSLTSEPRPLAIYGAQCWERLRHLLVTNQKCVRTPSKLGFALCCHSNATGAPIANPPDSAQLGGSLYHAPKLHPGPCSSVGVQPRTDTKTHRRAWPQYILRCLRLTQNVNTVSTYHTDSTDD